MVTINCFEDLCSHVGTDIYDDDERTAKALDKAIYKGTTCGAWVEKVPNGVNVGSIVEGCDQYCDVQELRYPFDHTDFWAAVQRVEDQADEIWKDTHGCEHCWPDGCFTEWGGERTFGDWPINPDCPECNGEGTIL